MSELIENQPNKQGAPAVQPPTDSDGHPVREWIDTLLQAAVIAKDKQKKPVTGEDEGSPGTTMPTTASVNAATTGSASYAAASGDKSEATIYAAPEEADKDVEAKTMAMPTPNANDAPTEAKINSPRPDKATSSPTPKRYRRRRCEVEGCAKFARYNSVCSAHGGRRLCGEAGCERVAQFGHKCSSHGGIKLCSIEGCRRAVQSRGFCKTHGGGVRCQHPDCAKGAISKGFCRSHGGGSRCAEPSCQKWAQRLGFCVRHSKAATDNKAEAVQPDAELIATIPLLGPLPPPTNIST